MKRIVTKIDVSVPTQPELKRVAAYSRVSSGKDAMLHSLSAQVSYFSRYIQSHPDWVYCGVYSDEAFTGTKEQREGFQRLMADCRNGKIDMVITKSISRFARNTVTLLQTVRELKSLGVDVYFEEQNIHTISNEGELLLTILASYAQEESRSASENQKWRIKKNFEEGIPWSWAFLGYRLKNGRYEVVESEAAVVRRIYQAYLDGMGYTAIAKMLNEEGIRTRRGYEWDPTVVGKVLSNYNYTGNLLLQKTYREDHLTKRTKVNKGKYPQYHVEGSHEAIIDMEMFMAVQREKERRAGQYNPGHKPKKVYPFSGLLVCEGCSKNYRRKVTATGPVWICSTFNSKGKAYCASKQIPEATLQAVTAEVLQTKVFMPEMLHLVSQITVCKENTLIYRMLDGTERVCQWTDRSRSQSWTEEKKNNARNKALERRTKNG